MILFIQEEEFGFKFSSLKFIYIYIYRERERERESWVQIISGVTLFNVTSPNNFLLD